MKPLPTLLLVLAGAATAYIAYQSPERDYEPVTLDAAEPPPHVPIAVTATPASGEVLRKLEVEGMCCAGCTAKLHERLVALPGVRAAAVDFDRGVAEVLVPTSVSADRLSAELTFEKYTARPLVSQP